MSRIPVIVPGLFGSALTDNRGTLWGSDLLGNFRNILFNSQLLRWEGGTGAEADLIETFTVTPVVKYHIWPSCLRLLEVADDVAPPRRWVKFGYDWRQSVATTATDLCSVLSKKFGAPASQPPPPHSDDRAIFLSHSMGGLVVMAAVGSHELHPNWIDRIVHIGAPLQGAPAAMQAAFDPNQWPFLPDLFEVVWKPGMSRYRLIQAMQKAAQSFESAYELMPPSAVVYAYQDLGTPLFNPLYHPETRFTKKQIALAMAFEQLLREADERLHACPRPLCCIYSDGLDTCVRLQIGY
jgi:pimeloyl-ACP methyl ester carboxylesterase